MYYTLYIDVLFLENLLLDYLLLTMVGRLLKLPSGRLRRLFGAALGSAGLCVIYVFSLWQTLAGILFFYVILSAAMAAAGLALKSVRMLGKAVFLLYLTSFLLGGLFQWLSRTLQLPVYPFLGITLVSYYLLSFGMEFLWRCRASEREILLVTIEMGEHKVKARGLLDTGNHLRDPILGKPVSILTQDLKEKLCGEQEPLWYPIPFHSIGKAHGLIPAFYADAMQIETVQGQRRIERPLLGLTKEPLSSKKEYDIILHPALLEQENSGQQQ